jgi:hypothetical protein
VIPIPLRSGCRLRSIADPAERQRVMAIPTTLHLDRRDVDDRRALASRLLTESRDFQELMKNIGAPGRPEEARR